MNDNEKAKTERALAMEEAARLALAQPNFVATVDGKRQNWVKAEIAEKLRKLAPLPPSLVAVPRNTWEQVYEDLEKYCCEYPECGLIDALTAMNEVKVK